MVYYRAAPTPTPPPPPPPPLLPSASPPPRYDLNVLPDDDELDRFYRRITVHGLLDVHRAKNVWLRGFWLITLIGALSAAVYGCYHILHQFSEASVVVSYFVHEFGPSFLLPDIVICPFNRFNADFLKQNNVSDDVAQHMQLAFGSSAKHPYQRKHLFRYFSAMERMEAEMKETLERLNMTFGEFLDAASLKCEDFFVDCILPTGNVPCCDYVSTMLTFAGKCFRFRGTNQSGPGYSFGMSIVVSLPKSLYSLAVNNWLNDGVVVKLAEPYQGVDHDLTFVPIGSHALLPLKAVKYDFINDPPRFECIGNAERNYSRLSCFDSCIIETAQNRCQCSAVPNMQWYNLPPCTTLLYHSCVIPELKKQFRASIDMETYFYQCRQRCKPRCSYWQYQTSVSYSKFPTMQARMLMSDEQEWTRMKNSIILDLYYERLEYTRIRHLRAMSLHAFIANLGGQCSLWLGASTLTLIQVLVLLVEKLYSICGRFWTLGDTNSRHAANAAGRQHRRQQSQSSRSRSTSDDCKLEQQLHQLRYSQMNPVEQQQQQPLSKPSVFRCRTAANSGAAAADDVVYSFKSGVQNSHLPICAVAPPPPPPFLPPKTYHKRTCAVS